MSFTFCSCPRLSASNASSISTIFSRLNIAPLTQNRGFKALRPATKISDIKIPNLEDNTMPPYPYGPRRFYKQADSGLYGGKTVVYGNKVSQGRNKGKTRRRWNPHVKLADLESKALERTLTIKVTYACLRTIKKCGGVDEYLLGDKPARIKELGLFGWRLRWLVMNTPAMREKFAAERKNLGLPPQMGPIKSFEEAWKDPEFRQKAMEEQKKAWDRLAEADERFRNHVKTQWKGAHLTRKYVSKGVIPEFEVKAAPLEADLRP